jgi:NAD(P)-dependent dehydrogenase (short-subunit alcohol dehydrogenase family)
MSTGRLANKVAIVTGAASGIGRATALRMAREGACVVVGDLNLAGAEAVVKEIAAAGGRAAPQQANVADEGSVMAMIDRAVREFGGLDVLHNNAAASDAETMSRDGDIVDLDVAIFDRTIAVNLRGPLLGCKHAIPRMLARGGGAIVNTSSAAAAVGDPVRTAYGASKAGLEALTRYVATQYGKRGIRCNAIAPGVIETPAVAANVPREWMAIYERSHLTPRLGRPEDIAAAVVFLASDDAAFITGQVLGVDGGLLAHHPAFGEFLREAGAK